MDNRMRAVLACGAIAACSLNSPTANGQVHYNVRWLGIASEDAAVSPNGEDCYLRVVFGDYDEGFVAIATAPPYAMQSECHLGGTPKTFDVSADGSLLWSTDYYSGSVRACSVAPESMCEVISEVAVGALPVAVRFDDSGRFLYVGENDPGQGQATGHIIVVDTQPPQDPQVVATLKLNNQAGQLAKAPGDAFMYTVTRPCGGVPAMLYKISTLAREIVASVEVVGYNDGCDWAYPGVSADGNIVYVPVASAHEIQCFDAASLMLLNKTAMPSPAAIHVAPGGNHALVLQPTERRISVVSLPDLTVLQSIPAPALWDIFHGEPRWSLDGKTVFVPALDNTAVLTLGPCDADCTNDGQLDLFDFLCFVNKFNAGCP